MCASLKCNSAVQQSDEFAAALDRNMGSAYGDGMNAVCNHRQLLSQDAGIRGCNSQISA
jgi:hypothetical protein